MQKKHLILAEISGKKSGLVVFKAKLFSKYGQQP